MSERKMIPINLDKYRTEYIVDLCKVSRQTVAVWKKKKQVPVKYYNQVMELIRA